MLHLDGVSFKVRDEGGSEREIIRDVDFMVDSGKLVVVTGPNGGGKSTLAKLIAGIEKPASGRILLDGEDITSLNITERARRGIAFAFQQPVRFKGLRVIDILRLAAGKTLSKRDACDLLAAVGLCAQSYLDREINSSLSGGELKRIEIATVFARSTKLSIFDEPEAGIDLWSFQNLTGLFSDMREKIKDASIMIISHQERILSIADEILVLRNGSIAEFGPREKILPLITGTELALGSCPKNGQGKKPSR